MKTYLSIVCVLAVACILVIDAKPLSETELLHWNNFKVSHGKIYTSNEDELQRQQIFIQNLKKIEEHNKLFDEGKKTFSLKMNHFGDLSEEEFKNRLMSNNMPRFIKPSGSEYSAPSNEQLPESVDWRTKGAVTPIKNQGGCGSCWSFSVTGSVEGQTFLKTGKLVSLSEQQLVDCGTVTEGCSGGWNDDAFRYIIGIGGLDTEDSYPYTGEEGECKFKKENIGATISNYTDVKAHSESDLQSAVANIGPIAVDIDASGFQFYSEGILYEESCNPEYLNHAVLVVGYGTSKDGDYWIVKNSWGKLWGMDGYVLMARNKNNNCGIATKASYPVI